MGPFFYKQTKKQTNIGTKVQLTAMQRVNPGMGWRVVVGTLKAWFCWVFYIDFLSDFLLSHLPTDRGKTNLFLRRENSVTKPFGD